MHKTKAMEGILTTAGGNSLDGEVDLSDLPFAAGLEPVLRFMYTGAVSVLLLLFYLW